MERPTNVIHVVSSATRLYPIYLLFVLITFMLWIFLIVLIIVYISSIILSTTAKQKAILLGLFCVCNEFCFLREYYFSCYYCKKIDIGWVTDGKHTARSTWCCGLVKWTSGWVIFKWFKLFCLYHIPQSIMCLCLDIFYKGWCFYITCLLLY